VIAQSFEPSKIEKLANESGYIIIGSFLPEEFECLCQAVTHFMLKLIQENLEKETDYNLEVMPTVHEIADPIIKEKLEKICRITPAFNIRTPYPVLWKWLASLWPFSNSNSEK